MSDNGFLWWVVYNPHTGDVLYTGMNPNQVKDALNNDTIQRIGYICQPFVVPVTHTTPEDVKEQVEYLLDQFKTLYGDPSKPRPRGVINSPALKVANPEEITITYTTEEERGTYGKILFGGDKPKPPGGVIGEPPTIPKMPAPAKRPRKVS